MRILILAAIGAAVLAMYVIPTTSASAWERRGEGEDSGDAAHYNPNTGQGQTAQENSAGGENVNGSRGGEAKTTGQGGGAAEGPNGKKCVKTRNGQEKCEN